MCGYFRAWHDELRTRLILLFLAVELRFGVLFTSFSLSYATDPSLWWFSWWYSIQLPQSQTSYCCSRILNVSSDIHSFLREHQDCPRTFWADWITVLWKVFRVVTLSPSRASKLQWIEQLRSVAMLGSLSREESRQGWVLVYWLTGDFNLIWATYQQTMICVAKLRSAPLYTRQLDTKYFHCWVLRMWSTPSGFCHLGCIMSNDKYVSKETRHQLYKDCHGGRSGDRDCHCYLFLYWQELCRLVSRCTNLYRVEQHWHQWGWWWCYVVGLGQQTELVKQHLLHILINDIHRGIVQMWQWSPAVVSPLPDPQTSKSTVKTMLLQQSSWDSRVAALGWRKVWMSQVVIW